MSFLHPEFLYFMLIPLFVLFALLLTQKESHEHFFTQEVMNKLRVGASSLSMKTRNVLFLFMGFFMIVSLAQPVINDGVVEVKAKSADIMIAFDISDSMLAGDVYPNRLKLAKEKAIELLKLAPNERIGVIAFAKNSYLVSPMSFDHGAVNFLLRQLDTSSITEKGTNFLSMLGVVDKNIKNKKKYLLIISDGGDKKDFSDEIAFAKKNNITVFVLGVGTKKGSPIKRNDGSFIKYKGNIIISKLNENIANLATKTGGVYIQNVKSDEDIKTMLAEINSKSEQKELKSEKIHKYIQLFYYPLGVALMLLLIATSSFSKRVGSGFVMMVLFLSINPHAKAGMLDFMDLKEAKKAYESGDYKKSAKLYESYAKESGDSKAYYDSANALYKQKKYKEALKAYEKANFKDKELEAKKLANMGNAHAKEMKQEELKKAIKSYEESLKLKEDKDVRQNMEEVKKLLKKQQQKSQNKKNQKNNKKQKNKSKNQKDKQNNKKENKQDKNSKDKNKKNKNDSSKSQKSKEKKESAKKDTNKKDAQKNREQQQKKQDLKKLDKGKKDDKKSQKTQKQPQQMKDKMSDAEEKKWLKQLNLQKSTYLYRLNTQKPKEENSDEKPW